MGKSGVVGILNDVRWCQAGMQVPKRFVILLMSANLLIDVFVWRKYLPFQSRLFLHSCQALFQLLPTTAKHRYCQLFRLLVMWKVNTMIEGAQCNIRKGLLNHHCPSSFPCLTASSNRQRIKSGQNEEAPNQLQLILASSPLRLPPVSWIFKHVHLRQSALCLVL